MLSHTDWPQLADSHPVQPYTMSHEATLCSLENSSAHAQELMFVWVRVCLTAAIINVFAPANWPLLEQLLSCLQSAFLSL